MSRAIASFRWLFAPLTSPSPWRAILWWEVRRIPINLLIGAYGIVCLIIFFAAINHDHVSQPGEDAVEPIALLFAPIAFNLCYTLGWLVEAPARAISMDMTPKLGPRLLLGGLIVSFCIISAPPVFWLGYICLQALGLIT